MRWATGLAMGLAVIVTGCDNQLAEQTDSEVKALQARCEVFKRECDTLKAAVDNMRAENSALERKRYGLQTENETLKKQMETERVAAAQKVEQLTKDLAAAKGSGVVPVAAVAPGSVSPSAATVDEATIAAQEKTVADFEARIVSLRPGVGSGRSKVASVIRGTIDQQMVPPAGGYISGGQIYRRVLDCSYSTSNWTGRLDYGHTHTPSCYRSEPIGPAVKAGDFRSSRDKDDAIRRAKDENLPLEQELASLEKELAAAKAKLAKLRAGQKGT